MYKMKLFSSNLDHLGKAGRRGPISWGKIKPAPQLLVNSRFFLKNSTFGDPMRIQLRDLTRNWRSWALKESEGDPFSFYTGEEEAKARLGKGKERLVEENRGEEEEEEEEEEVEEEEVVVGGQEDKDQEERPVATQRLPKPPTPDFEVDEGIFLPSQCENSFQKVACLRLLAPRWGDEGTTFHSLVKRVAILEVSVQPVITFISYSHH